MVDPDRGPHAWLHAEGLVRLRQLLVTRQREDASSAEWADIPGLRLAIATLEALGRAAGNG